MSPWKLVLTALQSIRLNWLRALLTLLGIVIGVGSVIVMTALGRGAQQEVEKSVAAMGDNLVIVTAGNRQFGGVSMGAGTSNPLTADEVKFLAIEASCVKTRPTVTPREIILW